jgi:hypothetical protein
MSGSIWRIYQFMEELVMPPVEEQMALSGSRTNQNLCAARLPRFYEAFLQPRHSCIFGFDSDNPIPHNVVSEVKQTIEI